MTKFHLKHSDFIPGEIHRNILLIALPAIVNNITVPLLGLCDTAIAGHLGDAASIGALAVGAMMLNVIYWLCGFLRAGTTGLAAHAFGASDFALARNVLAKALSIALVIAVAALLFSRPLEYLLFKVIAPEPEVAQRASVYFRICIWTAPAQLALMAISGWFIGMQNTVVPMVIAIGINVVNIIASLLLVFPLDFGFPGIAVGTLIANWIGLVAALFFVRNALRKYKANGKSKVKWSRFFSLNTDLFFRSACIMGVSLAMTSFGSRLGQNILAANAVMMQFFLFFSYFMDGFAFAAEALVGKAVGAKSPKAITLSVNAILKWGGAMALIFLFIYGVGVEPITRLLTDTRSVCDIVAEYRLFVVLLPPITVAAFIFDGVFIGLTRSRVLFLTTFAACILFFAIAMMPSLAIYELSNTVLWIAFETYLLLRGVLLALEYVKLQRNSLIL